jgi:hypothetical protein
MKDISLVCHLFGDICQAVVFHKLTLSPNIGVDYKGHQSIGPGPPSNRRAYPIRVDAWDWPAWEGDMHRTVRSERRLDTLGNHTLLASHVRTLTLRGYALRWYRYPSNPFERPPERRVLSGTVYDEFLRLRNTLIRHLHHFTQLRRLELFQYPVDQDLLKAIESHPTLKDLMLDFCWFPEEPSPLASITSMTLRHIPTARGLNSYFIPPVGPSPYHDIPDHHIASAYQLVSPAQVEQLDIAFGAYDSDVRRFFERFSERMAKAEFHRLHKMCVRSTSYPAETPVLLRQLFKCTPVLRELHISQSSWKDIQLEGAFPRPYMPELETLSCSLPWARFLVPGRPVKSVKMWIADEDVHKNFLAPTMPELDELLRPLTLSTSPITALHLPPYPPLAPVWILFPYLNAMFPALRDLRAAMAGEKMSLRQAWRCGTQRAGLPIPCIDTSEQAVERGLVAKLTADVRDAVGREFSGTRKVVFPPIAERIMAFRGIAPEASEAQSSGPPIPIHRHNTLTARPSGYQRRRSTASSSGSSTYTLEDVEMPHEPRQYPLAPLQAPFDALDPGGLPLQKPDNLLVSQIPIT